MGHHLVWGCPKMLVPPNHPFLDGIFPHKPSINGAAPFFGKPPYYILYAACIVICSWDMYHTVWWWIVISLHAYSLIQFYCVNCAAKTIWWQLLRLNISQEVSRGSDATCTVQQNSTLVSEVQFGLSDCGVHQERWAFVSSTLDRYFMDLYGTLMLSYFAIVGHTFEITITSKNQNQQRLMFLVNC